MKKRLFIGFAITVVVLLFLVRSISWNEVYLRIRSANPLLIAIASALNFLTIAARTARWQILLSGITTIGIAKTFRSYMGTLAINSVIPFRIGEAYRAHSLSRATGTSISKVVSTILVDRSLDVISFGVVVLMTALLCTLPSAIASKTYGTAFASIALVASFPIVARVRKAIAGSQRSSTKPFAAWLESLLSSYGCLSYRQAAWCGLLSLFSWIIQIGVALLICYAVGLKPPLGGAALIVIAVNLAMALPVTPAAIGVFQVAFLLAAMSYGFDREIAMAAATILQMTLVIPVMIVGIALLNRDLLQHSSSRKE